MNNHHISELLVEVKKVQLEMASEVKRICENHDIGYSLIAGTLLGAVRHGGFIPWDDDIDLGMLRKDYNKFIEVCDTELNPLYEIQSPTTDKHYGLTFIKLMKKDTLYIEKLNNDENRMSGIFIDIFPFDNSPDNKLAKIIHSKVTIFQKVLFMFRHDYNFHEVEGTVKVFIRKSMILISKVIPRTLQISMMNKTFQKYNGKKTENTVNIGGSYGYDKESIPKSYFEEYENIKFEEENYSVFKNYIPYLELFYGDYMKLPPIEQQTGKHAIETIKL